LILLRDCHLLFLPSYIRASALLLLPEIVIDIAELEVGPVVEKIVEMDDDPLGINQNDPICRWFMTDRDLPGSSTSTGLLGQIDIPRGGGQRNGEGAEPCQCFGWVLVK
jgi:hypothetical protein